MSTALAADGPATDRSSGFVDLGVLPSVLSPGIYSRAAIGLVVLATDQTVEHEFRGIIRQPGVAFFEARIPMANEVTPENLMAMKPHLAPTADLILPSIPLSVVAFGCTSASMVIGEDGVAAELRKVRPEAKFTNPVTGAFAAFRTLGMKRIALLTPYSQAINENLRKYFEGRGVGVAAMGTFLRTDDREAARISRESIRDAAIAAGRTPGVDGVFVSCTSLEVAPVVAEVEAATGKPLLSSNLAMAWHCLRLAGVDDPQPEFGMLYERGLAG
ncbi:MAG: Asp/Glu racemase [Thalassobaculum sp.]|uniref:maleate cis-trans isomerase family protein n=1 Tax=Thalassobaculum sp. TaxID=2022740 RepID=UPI0032EC50E0